MKKTLILSLVAAFIALAAGPAEAVFKSEQGSDFDHKRGTCHGTTTGRSASVKCLLDERMRIRYKFQLPRDARRVDVIVVSRTHGCCGALARGRSRWGAHLRHLLVEIRIFNYGSPLGTFGGTIRRVEVRYSRR
jgi:hypothetical protein